MRSARFAFALALIVLPAAAGAVQIVNLRNHTLELRREPGAVGHGIDQHTGEFRSVLTDQTDSGFRVVEGNGEDVGESAPADGLPAGVDRWYVGHGDNGVESISALLGSKVDAPAHGDAATAQPLRLAIHPLANPTASSFDVLCDLPGSEPASIEVFDVMGRRVTGRQITMATAGTARVRLDSGVRLAPGSYWLKLTQGSRTPVSLRVVVAR